MCLIQEKRESLTNEADGPKEPSLENETYGLIKMHWLSKFVFNTYVRIVEHNPWIVSWIRRLFAGIPPLRLGFSSRTFWIEFVTDKVELGQIFL
jgi:hypothetical protein